VAGDTPGDVARSHFATDSIFKEPKKICCRAVIASEAKQYMAPRNRKLDCFVASLLAMT
jgi:hypothetical protein